jgi:hypothetical protein
MDRDTSEDGRGAQDAPTTWTDLLIRNSTTDTGQIPAVGALSSSPDLIPYGTMPIPDPNTLLQDMTKDYGTDIVQGDPNYFYARGVNLAPGAESGTVHLYWTKASLITWPSHWESQELLQENGTAGSPVSANAANADFVTAAPLVWTPGAVNPGDHFCMIGRVVTNTNPNPLPSGMMEMPDYANWVANNRGMSWRNLVLVTDPNQPQYSMTVPYDQGTIGEAVYVFLQCDNIPNGCQVDFECGTPGPVPLMTLNKSTVTTYPSQVLGINTTVPANWSSNVTYNLWSNGNTLPSNAKLTLNAVHVPSAGSELERSGAGFDIREVFPTEMLSEEDRARAEIGPVNGILVGQHGIAVQAP